VQILPNIVMPLKGAAGLKESSEEIQALFLSRIHEKKGVFDLIPLWAMHMSHTPFKLIICGPGTSHDVSRLRQLISQYDKTSSIEYRGMLVGEEKEAVFSECDLFMLPSYSENYGNVIPEALSAGLPVLTTTAMPWSALSLYQAGWEIEPGPDGLMKFLKHLKGTERSQIQTMGSQAHLYYENNLLPEKIGEKYIAFYFDLFSR
jgi:glycosyltransferase involved in cell wall biosynthesis